MRKLMLSIALSCVSAQPVASEMSDLCIEIGKLAEVTMSARQSGTPIANMLSVSDDKALRAMILDAYKVPTYQSQASKDAASVSFSEKWLIACYEQLDKI